MSDVEDLLRLLVLATGHAQVPFMIAYIERWVRELGLEPEWKAALDL